MSSMIKPDAQIRLEVQDSLDRHPLVNTQNISVDVTDGLVQLGGWVDTYIQKNIAADIVGRIHGVRHLVEELQVQPAAAVNDSVLEQQARESLSQRSSTCNPTLNVQVKNGCITITGSTGNHYLKKMIDRALEDLKGVTGICNRVAISPAAAAPTHQQIRQSLAQCATIDARRLHIELQDRHVQVSGFARSMEEKQDAENAIWAVPGVAQVDNRIVVNYMNDFAY